jgi:hypothetical protein
VSPAVRRVGVHAIAQRILGAAEDLAARMVVAYRREIPAYAALPAEVVASEVRPVAHGFVQDFFTSLLDDAGGSPEPEGLTGAARRRLDLGISLDDSLHAFRVAGRVVWDEVVGVTPPGEEALLGELASRWLDYMDRASSAFANAYLTASHDSLRRLDARRRELLEALLSARDQAELTALGARFSMGFADRYTPVLLEGDGAAVAIDGLLGAAPEGTLGGPRGARMLLLLPGDVPEPSRLLRRAAPILAVWTRPAASGSALAGAVGDLESALAAARAAGRTTGIYGPDDLLLERLLVATPAVSAVLTATMQRLAGRDPDGILRATLRAYLACGSVPETARQLVIHVNTAAYRLRRVQELTGLDPKIPEQAAVLVLATRMEGEPT